MGITSTEAPTWPDGSGVGTACSDASLYFSSAKQRIATSDALARAAAIVTGVQLVTGGPPVLPARRRQRGTTSPRDFEMACDLISFCILDIGLRVRCADPELRGLLDAQWGHLASKGSVAEMNYAVSRSRGASKIVIQRPQRDPIGTADEGEFLYELDGDVTIELQKRRTDLFFLHAAAVEVNGKAFLFVAESGGGKSTTVWALLHHGFGYLSDELAPIDLSTLEVHAYPRALCLKRPPPLPYRLPPETVRTPRTLHIPVPSLPLVSPVARCPLAAMLFVNYCPTATAPSIQPITPGEAGARLYVNALNQLAHANAGLDAAADIAQSVPNFTLESADLSSTCALVCDQLSMLDHRRAR
jgi:hypothetical protein